MNWILIRGLARQQGHWHEFPSLLQNSLGGEVHFLDLPGVGSMSHETAPGKIRNYSESLHKRFQEIKEADPKKEWTLIAVSLGGMIGLDWIERYPDDFKHLITINTSAGDLNPPTERLQLCAIRTILKLFFSNNVSLRERTILELTTNTFDVTEEIIQKWVDINDESPLKRKTFLAQIIAASKFKVPSDLPFKPLILASEADRLTNYLCSKKLSLFFNAPAYFHHTAGHDLMLDDGPWIIDKIKLHLGM